MASPLVVDPITKCAAVNYDTPDTNYGGDTATSVRSLPPDKDPADLWFTYIEADISGIPGGQIMLATSKLEFYVDVIWGVPTIYGLHKVDDAWVENVITWTNKPGWEGSIQYTGWSGPGGASAYFSITGAGLATVLQDAYDNEAGLFSVFLTASADATDVGFTAQSDDGTNKPKLTVDYEAAPAAARRIFLC